MKKIHSTIYDGMLIQAESLDSLNKAVEFEILRDPKTKFLSKKATKEYLDILIEKYGVESEQVRLLKQKIRRNDDVNRINRKSY